MYVSVIPICTVKIRTLHPVPARVRVPWCANEKGHFVRSLRHGIGENGNSRTRYENMGSA